MMHQRTSYGPDKEEDPGQRQAGLCGKLCVARMLKRQHAKNYFAQVTDSYLKASLPRCLPSLCLPLAASDLESPVFPAMNPQPAAALYPQPFPLHSFLPLPQALPCRPFPSPPARLVPKCGLIIQCRLSNKLGWYSQ